jgi:hypothetical protein
MLSDLFVSLQFFYSVTFLLSLPSLLSLCVFPFSSSFSPSLITFPPRPGHISTTLYIRYDYRKGYAVAQLVEALCYKPEGRGFDSR